MNRERSFLESCTALGLALSLVAAPLGAAPSHPLTPEGLVAEATRIGGPDAVGRTRAALTEMLELSRDLAQALGQSQREQEIATLLERVPAASDAEVAVLAMGGSRLGELVAVLRELRDRRVDGATASWLDASGPTSSSVGFPDAPYSSRCGSVRPDTDGRHLALFGLQLARATWNIANRTCNQVVVVLGEGGNTSSVCILADATIEVTSVLLEEQEFCLRDVDAAEIEGSYDRLGHLHGDLDALSAADIAQHQGIINNDNANRTVIVNNDNANRDAIINNDNANRSAIVSNDNANRDAIVNNDNANRDAIVSNDNANRDLILARIGALAEDELRRRVEDNLILRVCTAWMYTPAFLDPAQTIPLGGHLSTTIAVVQKAVDNARLTGTVPAADLDEAQCGIDRTVALAAAAPPLAANSSCGLLIRAYEKATVKPAGGSCP